MIHAPGVAALRRWGLLDEVVATGCPPIETLLVRLRAVHDHRHAAARATASPPAYAPRRTVLDKILVDAAARRRRRGARALHRRRGRRRGRRRSSASAATARTATTVVERARVVIGADGRNSHVAKAVAARAVQREADAPVELLHVLERPAGRRLRDRTSGPTAAGPPSPTNDGLTMLVVGWPYAEADAYKADVEANYLKTLELAPEFAERVRGATRDERFAGGAGAQLLPQAVRPGLGARRRRRLQQGPDHRPGDQRRVPRRRAVRRRPRRRRSPATRSFDDAMAELPADPRRPRAADLRVHHAAGDARSRRRRRCSSCSAPCTATRTAMDAFVSITAGTVSPVEFFDPDQHRPHHGRESGVGPPGLVAATRPFSTASVEYEA